MSFCEILECNQPNTQIQNIDRMLNDPQWTWIKYGVSRHQAGCSARCIQRAFICKKERRRTVVNLDRLSALQKNGVFIQGSSQNWYFGHLRNASGEGKYFRSFYNRY